MEKPNFFVITGGPGSGKTTLLKELESRGYSCMPEVARQIIQEQVRSAGIALPWGDRELYTSMMLERSVDVFRRAVPLAKPVFADRGLPDTLGYARLIGITDDRAIRRACKEHRYAKKVFFAPEWKEIYKTDADRRQGFAEAAKTADVLRQVYAECGYQVIELPKASAQKRADFVLSQV
jgi:predicted ATPase